MADVKATMAKIIDEMIRTSGEEKAREVVDVTIETKTRNAFKTSTLHTRSQEVIVDAAEAKEATEVAEENKEREVAEVSEVTEVIEAVVEAIVVVAALTSLTITEVVIAMTTSVKN